MGAGERERKRACLSTTSLPLARHAFCRLAWCSTMRKTKPRTCRSSRVRHASRTPRGGLCSPRGRKQRVPRGVQPCYQQQQQQQRGGPLNAARPRAPGCSPRPLPRLRGDPCKLRHAVSWSPLAHNVLLPIAGVLQELSRPAEVARSGQRYGCDPPTPSPMRQRPAPRRHENARGTPVAFLRATRQHDRCKAHKNPPSSRTRTLTVNDHASRVAAVCSKRTRWPPRCRAQPAAVRGQPAGRARGRRGERGAAARVPHNERQRRVRGAALRARLPRATGARPFARRGSRTCARTAVAGLHSPHEFLRASGGAD